MCSGRNVRVTTMVERDRFADSEELVRNSGLPVESLIEVGTEHRLADEESLGAMLMAVEGASEDA